MVGKCREGRIPKQVGERKALRWSTLFTCFGLSWIIPRSVVELFACWWTFGRPRSVVILKMVTICLFWCLWKEINNRCFEDLERFLEDILTLFFHTLYLWIVAFVFSLSLKKR
jgi:hypothetical protein